MSPQTPKDPILSCREVSITYGGAVRAVRAMSFDVMEGECLALVGESGSGKSSIARAIIGLLPGSARLTGSIRLLGQEMVGMAEPEMRARRGLVAGFVWQNPFEACNPLADIRSHVAEAWAAHDERAEEGDIAERLRGLGINEPRRRMGRYPHQWSGGMLQRASIAAASARRPSLIVADEPTSALDADRADAIVEHLRQQGAALLLVSHDARLVARHADRVAVCYAGAIVEIVSAKSLITRPRHPYTAGLVRALPKGRGQLPEAMAGMPPDPARLPKGCSFQPRCGHASGCCAEAEPAMVDDVACFAPLPGNVVATAPPNSMRAVSRQRPVLVEASGLSRFYGRGAASHAAVAAADLAIAEGEVVGISGPSGCGKSTLLRLIAGIEKPSGGNVVFRGSAMTARQPGLVMPIFQDAAASIDARWPIWRSVVEPATAPHRPRLTRAQLRALADKLLGEVGLGHLDPEARPAELSGGQCQRVAIARALAADAALLVADEPSSALDPSVSAVILRLLRGLADRGTAILMVSHDRAMLDAVCDRVLLMRDGILGGATREAEALPALVA